MGAPLSKQSDEDNPHSEVDQSVDLRSLLIMIIIIVVLNIISCLCVVCFKEPVLRNCMEWFRGSRSNELPLSDLRSTSEQKDEPGNNQLTEVTLSAGCPHCQQEQPQSLQSVEEKYEPNPIEQDKSQPEEKLECRGLPEKLSLEDSSLTKGSVVQEVYIPQDAVVVDIHSDQSAVVVSSDEPISNPALLVQDYQLPSTSLYSLVHSSSPQLRVINNSASLQSMPNSNNFQNESPSPTVIDPSHLSTIVSLYPDLPQQHYPQGNTSRLIFYRNSNLNLETIALNDSVENIQTPTTYELHDIQEHDGINIPNIACDSVDCVVCNSISSNKCGVLKVDDEGYPRV